MKIVASILVLVVAASNFVIGDDKIAVSDKCMGPGRVGGLCIPITDCPRLLNLTTKGSTDEEKAFLKNLGCGFDETVPKVCCEHSCRTPDGILGTCVDHIGHCEHLKRYTKDNTQEATKYIQQSRCNGRTETSVCCGPSAFNKQDDCDNIHFPPLPRTGCCGIEVYDYKIFSGTMTNLEQYPWLALIEYETPDKTIKLLCSGSLISSRYVLSAAHCFVEPITRIGIPKNVRLGEYDTSNNERDCITTYGDNIDCNDPIVTIAIDKVIIHFLYSIQYVKNDIAVVKMKNNAPYTDFIRPICLPETDLTTITRDSPRYMTVAAGWGAFNESLSPLKVHTRLHLVDNTECDTASSRLISRSQFCAQGSEAKDSRKTSPGGPLMLRRITKYELAGIASVIPEPSNDIVPVVYTNVFKFKDWIFSNIIVENI